MAEAEYYRGLANIYRETHSRISSGAWQEVVDTFSSLTREEFEQAIQFLTGRKGFILTGRYYDLWDYLKTPWEQLAAKADFLETKAS